MPVLHNKSTRQANVSYDANDSCFRDHSPYRRMSSLLPSTDPCNIATESDNVCLLLVIAVGDGHYLPALGVSPPAIEMTSSRRFAPNKGYTPGFCTSPRTNTPWLEYSRTKTTTWGDWK